MFDYSSPSENNIINISISNILLNTEIHLTAIPQTSIILQLTHSWKYWNIDLEVKQSRLPINIHMVYSAGEHNYLHK